MALSCLIEFGVNFVPMAWKCSVVPNMLKITRILAMLILVLGFGSVCQPTSWPANETQTDTLEYRWNMFIK